MKKIEMIKSHQEFTEIIKKERYLKNKKKNASNIRRIQKNIEGKSRLYYNNERKHKKYNISRITNKFSRSYE